MTETSALSSLIKEWGEYYARDIRTLRHLMILTERMFLAMEKDIPRYSTEPGFPQEAPELIEDVEKLGSLLDTIIRTTKTGNLWQKILIAPRADRARRSLNSALFILEAFCRDANYSPDQALTTEELLAAL